MNNTEKPDVVGELRKCVLSFPYFCKTYVKIQHPKLGLIPFELNKEQEQVIEHYEKNKFTLLKKYRQGGFTTLTSVYGLYLCLFNLEKKVGLLTKTDREAKDNCQKIISILNAFPDWLSGKINTNSNEIRFISTDSRFEFYSSEPGKSSSKDLLIFDEAAFIPNMENAWNCYFPCLANDGKCIILSTPNGVKNWFWEIYQKTNKGENQFTIVEVDYKNNPFYQDPLVVEQMKKQLGDRLFFQEIEAHFLADEVKEKSFCFNPFKVGKSTKDINERFSHESFNCFDVETKPAILVEPKKDDPFVNNAEMPLLDYSNDKEFDIEKEWGEDKEDLSILSGVEKPQSVFDDEDVSDEEILEEWYSGEAISKMWENIAEVMPEYKDEANRLSKRFKKKKDYSIFSKSTITPELLQLAGVDVDPNEKPEKTDYKDELLDLIHKGMPENMELDFDDDFLCINQVPTKITRESVEMAFNGLLELCGPDVALATVVKILKEKLSLLF